MDLAPSAARAFILIIQTVMSLLHHTCESACWTLAHLRHQAWPLHTGTYRLTHNITFFTNVWTTVPTVSGLAWRQCQHSIVIIVIHLHIWALPIWRHVSPYRIGILATPCSHYHLFTPYMRLGVLFASFAPMSVLLLYLHPRLPDVYGSSTTVCVRRCVRACMSPLLRLELLWSSFVCAQATYIHVWSCINDITVPFSGTSLVIDFITRSASPPRSPLHSRRDESIVPDRTSCCYRCRCTWK